MAIFPLFITKRYSNITVSKFAFFMALAVSSILICFIFCEPVEAVKEKKKSHNNFFEKINETDKASLSFLMFFIVGAVSVLVSPYHYSSLCGYAGRYMGFDFIIGVILFYLFAKRYYRLSENAFIFFCSSGTIVIILGLIQFFGFDPFSLKIGFEHEKLSMFLSTIGNVNVFASFIALLLPIAVYMLCFNENNKYTGVYITGAVFSFIAVFISNSDSAYLALLCSLWLVAFLSFENRRAFYKIFFVAALFFVTAFVFGLVCKLFENHYHLSRVTGVIISEKSIIPALMLFLCGMLIRKKPICERVLRILKYIYVSLSMIAVTAFFSAMIYFSVFNKTADIGFLESYLRFNDSWGTERGLIWRLSLRAFSEMPLINKIFGYGEDTVVILLASYVKKEMLSSGYYTDNAHNEFLQYLLTMGVAGFAAYISLLFFSLKKLFNRRKESVLFGAVAISVSAYAFQSLVNINQPITTPLFFAFIAFSGCALRQKQSLKRVNIKNNKKR